MSSVTSSTADPESPLSGVTLTSVRHRLLRGSAWVFGAKIGTIILGLVLNVLLARLLPPGQLGAYFTSYTLVLIGSTIAQLGLDRAVVRLVSAALAVGLPGRARDSMRTVFLVSSLGALAMGVLLITGVGGWLARDIYHANVLVAAMPLIAGWLVITAVQGICVETFRSLQRFAAATIFDAIAIDILLATAFGTIYALGRRATVYQVIAISTVLTGFVTVIGVAFLRRWVRPIKGEGHVERREIFTLAWPLLVTNLSIYILGTGADLWVLGAFRPQSDVALYGEAARLMLIVGTPFMIVSAVVPPIISELHAQGKKREREIDESGRDAGWRPRHLRARRVPLGGGAVLAFLFGDFYREAATVLAILSIARLVAVWTGSSGVVLMMTGHQKTMMYVTIFSGTLSVGAGILAASRYGRVGLAIATGSAQILQNLLQLFFVRRLVGIWTQAELSPRPFIRFFFGRHPEATHEPDRDAGMSQPTPIFLLSLPRSGSTVVQRVMAAHKENPHRAGAGAGSGRLAVRIAQASGRLTEWRDPFVTSDPRVHRTSPPGDHRLRCRTANLRAGALLEGREGT